MQSLADKQSTWKSATKRVQYACAESHDSTTSKDTGRSFRKSKLFAAVRNVRNAGISRQASKRMSFHSRGKQCRIELLHRTPPQRKKSEKRVKNTLGQKLDYRNSKLSNLIQQEFTAFNNLDHERYFYDVTMHHNL